MHVTCSGADDGFQMRFVLSSLGEAVLIYKNIYFLLMQWASSVRQGQA